ncbi:MAG: hypothetical protein JO073_10900 [Actinobacteria bacterium]|nr:hypothetical protein [Actinomycetota bacterium]
MGVMQQIKQWLGLRREEARDVVEGGIPVSHPVGGAEEEISSNAQGGGASSEPWPGREGGEH